LNKKFVQNAPREIVEKEKEKLKSEKKRLQKIEHQKKLLKS
jgi:valyl-tRNA synthetase